MKNKEKTKSELLAEIERLQIQAINDLAMVNNLRSEFRWQDRCIRKYKIALERIAEIDNGSVACEIAQTTLDENE